MLRRPLSYRPNVRLCLREVIRSLLIAGIDLKESREEGVVSTLNYASEHGLAPHDTWIRQRR